MEAAQKCPECSGEVKDDIVRMSLWKNDRLIVIEDIPAMVCNHCLEQYYDELTRYRIERLGENGFSQEKAKRLIEVPVFSLSDVVIKQPVEAGDGDMLDEAPDSPDWSDFNETG